MERSIHGFQGLVGEAQRLHQHFIVGSARVGLLERAAREGECPFPEATISGALRRGYDPVPLTARRLPVV